MVEKKPVSLLWQTVLIFIPLGAVWAFYRINKLRNGLLLILLELGIVVVISIILGITIGLIGLELTESEAFSIGIAIEYPTYGIINVYFIRKWSKEWNSRIVKASN